MEWKGFKVTVIPLQYGGLDRAALMCCALEPKGQVLGTDKGGGQGDAGEAETNKVVRKGLSSSCHASWLLNIYIFQLPWFPTISPSSTLL